MGETGLDFADIERLLLESEFLDCRQVWSSNYVYIAQLCAPTGQPFAAIYKPLRGESPLWDFPTGGLYRREVAAYRLAQLLGWPFIPPTVVRKDGPEGVGSLQVYIRHDPEQHFFVQRDSPELVPQLQRIAVFDIIANNADRKGGHCLIDDDGRIWGIDHGLCFHPQYKLRSVIWDWAEQPIPEELLGDLRAAHAAIDACDEHAAGLLELLAPDEFAAVRRRIEQLLENPRFPLPGPHRHYPWPLV